MNNRNIHEACRSTAETSHLAAERRRLNLFSVGAFRRARRSPARAIVALSLAAGLMLLDARADITTGLVGYWNLSDGPGASNVVDYSGNTNTGTLKNFADTNYNNMWTTNSDPTNGWPFSLQFNQSGQGTNTYVNIPDSPSLDTPSVNKAWSISAWVNCSVNGGSEPANAGIVSKGLTTTGVAGTYAYDLYMSGGKFTAEFRNSPNSGGTSGSSSTVPVSNTWYHVVAVVHVPTILVPPSTSNSEVWIYVNGVQQYGTNSNTYTTMFTNNEPVTIGCFGPGANPFQGKIDEVRIYNRELTASDVTQLYNNKAFSVINNGIGSWNGLAGSGGNAALDTTSLNFCTNLYSAPVGTADNLADVLNLENAGSLPLGCAFADGFYSSGIKIPVASSNLTTVAGGVAAGSANGPGTFTFINSLVTYTVNSSDNIGIKDGANPTSLTEAGPGTLVLTGTNTFSGGVAINSGTVQVGNGGAVNGQELGAAATVTDNGTLAFDGNNSAIFTNIISGNGSVTQKGSGTLTLGTNNTYTNSTTISNGSLSVISLADGASSLGTSPVVLSGGTLLYAGTGDTTARPFTVMGTNSTLNVPASVTLTLTGVANGVSPGSIVTKTGSGTLVIGQNGTASSSYFGMNINGGMVILTKTSQAIGYATTVNSGGTLQLANSSEIYSGSTAPISINSGGVFDLNGANNTLYTLALSGVGIGRTGALINSATNTSSTLTCPITLGATTSMGGSGNITLPGAISGNGASLIYVGTGKLTLSGTNTYSGSTTINSGTLDGAGAGSIPGSVTVNAGTLELDSAFAMSPVAALNLPNSPSSGAVYLNFSGTQTIVALVVGGNSLPAGVYDAVTNNPDGLISGTGLLNVVAIYWDANHTDAGASTNVNGGGSGSWDNTSTNWWVSGNLDTTWASNNVAFFAGTAGTVTLNANESTIGLTFLTAGYDLTNTDGVSALTLSGDSPIISVPSGNTSIGCSLTGGGAIIGLTASGPGTLSLTGSNNYANGTQVTGGATLSVSTISDSGASAIGNSGTVMLAGGTLSYAGLSAADTGRSVTGSGTNGNNNIDVPAGSLEVDGAVEGTSLHKTSSGTLILGGSVDNPSLGLAIDAGKVIITKSSASSAHGLGGATSTVASGAELQLAGSGNYDLYSGCVLTVSNGGLFDVNGQSDSFSTLTISGAGIGGGVLINSATNTTSGLTNGGSGVVLAANATIGGPGSITLNSVVSGSGTMLTYAGTGTLVLTNANTYGGGTIINSGGTVLLTNSANSAGSGTITVNGTLDVGIVGNNVVLPNAISGPGIVNLAETANNNLQLGGSMAGFTGTLNCPASASTAKAQILTTNVALTSAATINIAAGGSFYVADSGVIVPAPINIYGVGNSEVYGALRIENNAVISGPVTLYANTTMGNGVTSPSQYATISGPITQSGGTYGITFTAVPGVIVLSGTNTFGGAITISGGELTISGAGNLGSGNYAAAITNNAIFDYASSIPQTLSGVISGTGLLTQSGPGTLTLTGAETYTGATVITNGSTLMISGGGGLGAATSTNYGGSISNYGTLTYAGSAAQNLSGVISGTGALVENGPGALTLSGVNDYTGGTQVAGAATLALASTGSINNTASVGIAKAGTFDVSAFGLSFTFGGSTTLSAAGTGIGVGATAATVKGGSSGTINVGALTLTFTPVTFTGDTTHPALYVSQGALNLSTGITVTNAAATPLGVGTYSLVQVAGGNISAASANVTVTGTGLAPGTAGSLAVSGGSVNLVVVNSSVPVPVINSFMRLGGNLIFSGTNGPANGTYYVLTTTNVALNLTNWTAVATNTFSATGTFSVTNAIGGGRGFYAIEVP